jgi:hypothetical protein
VKKSSPVHSIVCAESIQTFSDAEFKILSMGDNMKKPKLPKIGLVKAKAT